MWFPNVTVSVMSVLMAASSMFNQSYPSTLPTASLRPTSSYLPCAVGVGHDKPARCNGTAVRTQLTSEYHTTATATTTTTTTTISVPPPRTSLTAINKNSSTTSNTRIKIRFYATSAVWTGRFSPGTTILTLKKALEKSSGMMWGYLTLLHERQALIDDQATLGEIGFTGGDVVELRVVFATSTVTEIVFVTASATFKEPDIVTASASLAGLVASVGGMVETGNFQPSTRLV